MTSPGTTAPGQQKLAALDTLLRNWGCTVDDFEIHEDRSSDLGQLFGLAGGILVVRRRGSGEERIYATGIGSAWASALIMDLSRGLLGPCGKLRQPETVA